MTPILVAQGYLEADPFGRTLPPSLTRGPQEPENLIHDNTPLGFLT
jgi:hypothetical protein